MYKKLILLSLLSISTILGSSPAKPGVIASDKVKLFTKKMAVDYSRGGLVIKMQRIKESNIQIAESGSRSLREDVYMSFPVILGSYADSDDKNAVVGSLQAELFDGPWPTVTMAEHYEEMSYGQFHLSGTVFGWYELPANGSFYEGSQTVPYDNGFVGPEGGAGEFIHDALVLADLDIDFTQYDNDGPDGIPNSGDDDGYVDAVFFAHSGSGGEAGGPYIWSHSWTYSGWWGSAFTTDDIRFDGTAILVQDYIMQPIENSAGGLIEIGVFSHEFGHALGLPDLYDTDYSSDGIGDWCLMSGGSWTTPSSPTHMSAWCKEMLGWIVPIVPDVNIDAFEFPNVEENAFVVKLWTKGELGPYMSYYSHGQDVGREYFLIENRQRIGTEQHIPGTGILIYHIDNSLYSNSNEDHRMVDVRAADGFSGGSDPGDPWPGTSNNYNFDFQTIPSSMSWGGANTEVALLNISESDSTMTADVEIEEADPHLNIVDRIIIDSNDDGFLSPDESGVIWLELANYGILTTGITARLISESAAFNFNVSEISFADIPTNTTAISTSPFEFTLSSSFEPGTENLQVAVSNTINGTIDTLSFDIIVGDPQVAIVDADGFASGGEDFQEYYRRALQDIDVVFTVWDIALDGLPTAEWLLAQPKLIWFTGNSELPLTQSVIDLLASYQDAGGRLMLTGQDLTSGAEIQAGFLAEYCAAVYVETVTNPVYVFGDPEHEIMTTANQYIMNNYFGAENQTSPDIVTNLSHGSPLFQYPLFSYRLAGTTTIQNGYKTVFMAFGFESLAPLEDDGWETRADLIDRILNWFDIDYVAIDSEELLYPDSPGITNFYPNPFNPSITISYALPENMDIKLFIYDITGREVVSLVDGQQITGYHDIQWNGIDSFGNSVSTGVYFARLEAGSYSQSIKIVYLK